MPQATLSLPIHDETARNTFKHRHDTGPPEGMLARFQNHNNVPMARCKTRGGRAWPGFEPTRRATLAARTASGRAAAHRHTQRPERASAALQAPPVRRFRRAWPQCWWAVAGPGRASSRRAEHQQHCKRRRCGGCRRVRRARAGFEIDHSERSSRVAISRAAGPDGARNNSGATSNTAQGRGPAGPRP